MKEQRYSSLREEFREGVIRGNIKETSLRFKVLYGIVAVFLLIFVLIFVYFLKGPPRPTDAGNFFLFLGFLSLLITWTLPIFLHFLSRFFISFTFPDSLLQIKPLSRLYEEAEKCMLKKSYSEALRKYETIVERDFFQPLAQYRIAEITLKWLEMPEVALYEYRKVLKQKPPLWLALRTVKRIKYICLQELKDRERWEEILQEIEEHHKDESWREEIKENEPKGI